MSQILLVDDDINLTEGLKIGLGAAGHAVTVVHTSDECRAALRESSFDIILLDIQLEGPHDGLRLAEVIRRTHDLPILFISGSRDKHTMALARATAATSYVCKPFTADQIDTTLTLLIRQHALVRSLQESEHLHRIVVEASQDGILACNSDLVVRMANSRAAELLGRPAEELLGLSIHDLMPSRAVEEIMHLVRQADTTSTPVIRRFRSGVPGPSASGWEIAAVAWQASPRSHNVLLYVRSAAQPVEADASLEDAQRRLESALEAGRSGIWEFRPESRQLILSRVAKDVIGLPGLPDAPSARDMASYLTRRALVHLHRSYLKHVRGSAPSMAGIISIAAPGQPRRWVRYEGRINEYRADGRPGRVMGVLRDVTAEKERDDSLRARLFPELLETLLVELREFHHGQSGAAMLSSLGLIARNASGSLRTEADPSAPPAASPEAIYRRLQSLAGEFTSHVSRSVASIVDVMTASHLSDQDHTMSTVFVARGRSLETANLSLRHVLPDFVNALNPGQPRPDLVQRLSPSITASTASILNDLRVISQVVDASFTSPLAEVLRIFEERARVRDHAVPIHVEPLPQAVDVIMPMEELLKSLLIVLENAVEAMVATEADERRFRLTTIVHAATVQLRCEDCGPGFGPEIVSAAPGTLPSGKDASRGFGLRFVERTLRKFGGRLHLSASPLGGACVTFNLRRP